MSIEWLLDRLKEQPGRPAWVWHDQSYTYAWLSKAVSDWQESLRARGVQPGQVVGIEGDHSPSVGALLLALINNRNIVVPLTSVTEQQRVEFSRVAEVQAVFSFDRGDGWQFKEIDQPVTNPLLVQFLERGAPGLVLFTSGSTGNSKAALHDFQQLLEKFKLRRKRYVTISFLFLDHIGGINTLFYTLANGGTLVSLKSRAPAEVCQAIDKHQVQLLPTSPTFLNLLLLSEQYKDHSLASLELITYGTEVMPESTLRRLGEAFPRVNLLQTYGLSEVGILRSKSKSSGSLYVQVGGEGYETKIVDGTLWIKARSAMLGYLNAPSPFDQDGWFNTGDAVEVDGDYIRILGRKTEIINVGGQKVYPAEVESILLQMENVTDVTVGKESNPFVGNIVVARVNLARPEDPVQLKRRIRDYCKDRLESFKIPAKVIVAETEQYGLRFKRMRKV